MPEAQGGPQGAHRRWIMPMPGRPPEHRFAHLAGGVSFPEAGFPLFDPLGGAIPCCPRRRLGPSRGIWRATRPCRRLRAWSLLITSRMMENPYETALVRKGEGLPADGARFEAGRGKSMDLGPNSTLGTR